MIPDSLRPLLYPLGLITSIFFTLQWISGERKKKSRAINNNLYFVAGEQSGDLLGEKLLKALQKGEYYGVGGEKMRAAGLKCNLPMEKLQTMGFIEVIKAVPRLFFTFRKIKREILELQPKGVVFIDYPDFNMRLAKALRKKGYTGKLIHYVCPSVWAWRKHRIKDLAETLDLLLSIFPFEKHCFSHTKLPVTYIGHPLVAVINHHVYDPDWNPKKRQYLSIFPGSRPSEIALNLPLQLQAAEPFAHELPLAISVAHPELEKPIRKILSKTALKAALVPNYHRYELMRDSYVALATSGTVNLELGLHAIPSVVTYQIGIFNYLLSRYVFRIILPYYSIVNIICGQELYPEFIHRTLDPKEISAALQKRIEGRNRYYQHCLKLRSHLQTHDASQEAAKAIHQIF